MSDDSRKTTPPKAFEKVVTVVCLLVSTGAFMSLAIEAGQTSEESSSWIGKIVALLIYLLALFLLVRHCKGFIGNILRERYVLAIVALAICSAYWSDNPRLSLLRGFALIGTSLFGVYFASRYDLREQIRLLAWMCGIAMFCSFIFGWFDLGQSGDQIKDAWFGIYQQKNVLGRIMAFGAVVFLFFGRINKPRRWLAWSCAMLCMVLIVLAKSNSALAVLSGTVVMLAVFAAFRRSVRRGLMLLSLVGTAVVSLIYWVVTHLQEASQLVGRSLTLTGRLTMWILCFAMALRRPWLGYGFNAFWQGREGPSARIARALDFTALHAHNGFLEILLDLGLVGLLVFGIGFVIYVWRACSLLRKPRLEFAWPLMCLTFVFLANLTEGPLVSRNDFFWVLYTATAFNLFAQVERVASPVRERSRRKQVVYGVRARQSGNPGLC
jgi:exopolysaccharide production protein ExoQ